MAQLGSTTVYGNLDVTGDILNNGKALLKAISGETGVTSTDASAPVVLPVLAVGEMKALFVHWSATSGTTNTVKTGNAGQYLLFGGDSNLVLGTRSAGANTAVGTIARDKQGHLILYRIA